MTSTHTEDIHDSNLEAIDEDYERVQGGFVERLAFPTRLQVSLSESGGTDAWEVMPNVGLGDFEFGPASPPVRKCSILFYFPPFI